MLKSIDPSTTRHPLVLGYDVSGIVEDIGGDVKEFKIGDQIYSRVPNHQMGTFADYVVVDQAATARKPSNLR
jgi:NADPH:quinone reductase-like Zn-dependent oxidoreductase